MNVTEANAWNKVIRSLKAGASDEEREAGIEAATLLSVRAYTTLHAGPSSDIVAHVLDVAHDAIAYVSTPTVRTLDGSTL